MNYYDYIKSNEWKNKREWTLFLANYKCQICNSGEILNVHHRTYENLGMEKPGDLMVLCKGCHELFHHKLEKPPEPEIEKTIDFLSELYDELKRIKNDVGCNPKQKETIINDIKYKIVTNVMAGEINIAHESLKLSTNDDEIIGLLSKIKDIQTRIVELKSDNAAMLEYFDLYCSDKIT